MQRAKPLTDFYGEDRHELVQNLHISTGKKEAVRSGHRKLIGSRPKRLMLANASSWRAPLTVTRWRAAGSTSSFSLSTTFRWRNG
jgi:hypothetical protein